jgi:arabinose-5-phosphate isomerase
MDRERRERARQVMRTEAAAILKTAEQLDGQFDGAVSLLLNHPGKIIVSGVGKSGFIARKIAGTLTSTGLKAIFLHPTEALHGDLGIYAPGDPTILVSRSGATEELLTLIPILRHFQSPLIGILGNVRSPIAECCDFTIESYVDREADPLAMIPTTSAITALAVGDALASALMDGRHFGREDFALLHPGGQIGRNLHLRVADAMHPVERVAVASPEASIRDVVAAMTRKPLGACCIVGEGRRLIGIITDGDIRRYVQHTEGLGEISARDILCASPRCIRGEDSLGQAVFAMESGQSQVGVLPVVDDSQTLLGLLRLHDAYRHPC